MLFLRAALAAASLLQRSMRGIRESNVVSIADSALAAGLQRFGLLAATDSDARGALSTPKGLEMLIVTPVGKPGSL